jgi:hypothetical protein
MAPRSFSKGVNRCVQRGVLFATDCGQDARSYWTEQTQTVRFVHNDSGAKLLCDCENFLQGSHVSVHAVDAFNENDNVRAGSIVLGQFGLQIDYAVVLKGFTRRVASPCSWTI